ncbi:MAG: hypothetical protein KTR30_14030 [Saprospiraceae bacterium]|nr:hypothetical protein [Saprospiraceae bacterium]
MKKTLLLLALLTIPFLLSAQYFRSKPLTAGYWGSKSTVKISTVDSTYNLEIKALSKRLKGTKFRIKPIKINGDTYRIVRTEDVIHIKNESEETVLMTSNRQMQVVMADGTTFQKDKFRRRNFSYLNESGEVVIEARLRDNVFSHVVEINMYEDEPLLLALCVEMLTRLAREQIWL